MYLDACKFLPSGVKNTLQSAGAWNLDDYDWGLRIEEEEKTAISVIRAYVNFTELEKDYELTKDLVKKYVTSQLYLPLEHIQGMVEQGDLMMTQFLTVINSIKDNQKEAGLKTSENYVPIAGIIIG